MKATSVPKGTGYLVIGGAVFFLAVAYLGLSFRLPFGRIDQPGAAVFPIIVGVVMMIGSLATMWEGWKLGRAKQVEFPEGPDRNRLLLLVVFLLSYFLALPLAGYIPSTVPFSILLMRILSKNLGWPRIIAYSLSMTLVVYASFILLLKVPMPRGIVTF